MAVRTSPPTFTVGRFQRRKASVRWPAKIASRSLLRNSMHQSCRSKATLATGTMKVVPIADLSRLEIDCIIC
jgi:hypothetical protein